MSLLTNRGPRCAPRPRLACHAPKMTLRQICRMLKVMKQIRNREAAAAASPT
uniref:Si:ch211-172l8.4 n=1 Tax=Astatotilapia calliptera TaxID=8154 RepID=A0A3P8QLG6_ASTCA